MGFAGVLAVGGLGLLLAIELVFAKVAPWPEGPPRWNTAYKVSIQAWILLGLGAGAMAAVLLSDAREAVAEWRAEGSRTDAQSRRWPTVLAGVLVVGVILLSSPFPVMVAATEVGDHLQAGNDLYLDGLENHERYRPGEMAAINWLDEREGRPTIVEAPGRAVYSWTNPASSLTGIPTVVGWLRAHEENYRPQERIDRRVAAVDALYSGSWTEAVDTLRTYDVEYVYVGPVERERYGSLGERFQDRAGLSVAFESDAVTIYRVTPADLPTA